MEVFWQRGFQGASIAVLGRAMGLKPGSIYAAFGNKDQLFREALEAYVERVRRVAVARKLAPRAIIERWFAEHINHALGESGSLGRGCLLLNSAAEYGHLDEDAARLVRAELAALEGFMRKCVVAARKTAPRDEAPTAANTARLLVAALAGISTMSRSGASRKELEGVARAALAAI